MSDTFAPGARAGIDFEGRLDDIRRRLDEVAPAPLPAGLTDPDPGGEERWEAAQVWAHMAEFVGYWHDQLRSVIAEYAGDPVPFGRTKRDAARIAAIELGRHEPVDELARRTREALAAVTGDLAGLSTAEWKAAGLHETVGVMDLEAIVERFIVGHMEEHLDQLKGLATATATATD
ncbi:MAG: hypothetical protein H0V87_06425 [Chloroflexi bacterium]|jgi:hypothetical protein|nr:hypothetical protein [Chloroflexota bacterium]